MSSSTSNPSGQGLSYRRRQGLIRDRSSRSSSLSSSTSNPSGHKQKPLVHQHIPNEMINDELDDPNSIPRPWSDPTCGTSRRFPNDLETQDDTLMPNFPLGLSSMFQRAREVDIAGNPSFVNGNVYHYNHYNQVTENLAQISTADSAARRNERRAGIKELGEEVKELNQLLQEKIDELAWVEDTANRQNETQTEDIKQLEAEVGMLRQLLQEKTAELASLEDAANREKEKHEKMIRVLEERVSRMITEMSWVEKTANRQNVKQAENIKQLEVELGKLNQLLQEKRAELASLEEATTSIMPTTPVVRLNDLSFDRCGPKAIIGTFTATTDSRFQASIEVEAIIKYGRTKIGKIKSQTLDFSRGPHQLEAHFFDDGPNLNHDGREFLGQYFTTKNDINLDVLNMTSAFQFEAQATGIATLGVKDIIAWVRGSILEGHAEYSITIKHPLPSFALEIIELSFVATVGGDNLLEGKLKNFPIDAGFAEKNTGRHPGTLCQNQLTTLWAVTTNSKVDVEITSASVMIGGLHLSGLQFHFNKVDFKVNGPLIGSFGAGVVSKWLSL